MKNIKDIKKVLIIRLSALGDTIHTLPLAAAIKDYNKDVEIGWVVEDKAMQFVVNNPLVDKVFVVPKLKWKKRGLSLKSFFEFAKIINNIQKEHYDVAIDTQQLLKSGILLGLSGAKTRITNSDAREFSWIFANKLVTPKTSLLDSNTHVIERYFELASVLGMYPKKTRFEMPPIRKKTIHNVSKLLKGMVESDKPVITLAPATTWVTKHWANENWAKLIDEFAINCNILMTGTKKDVQLVNDILSKTKYAEKVINLTGKTSLDELYCLLKNSHVVISPDSGSAHMAWAAQKPFLVTVFTSTSKNRTGPYGSKCVSIQGDRPCQPCHKKKCKNNLQCTNEPDAHVVVKLVQEAISGILF